MKKSTSRHPSLRALSLLCAAALLLVAFAGCTSNAPAASTAPAASKTPAASTAPEAPAIDISKFADLTMYLIGEPARDYDMMLEKLNAKLKEDLNASLKVSWCGWGEFPTKYPLMLASGEAIDITYASTWTKCYDEAAKGAFLPLEEMMPIYAPKTLAEITPDFLGQVTLNGHMFAVPAAFFQYGMMGFIMRGDLMKKYGMTEIKNIDDYGTFLKNVHEQDPQILPGDFTASSTGLDSEFCYSLDYLPIKAEPFYVKSTDAHPTVVAYYEDPGLLDHYKKMREWSEAGYWPKDVLTNKDDKQYEDGKAASRLHNFDSWRNSYLKHPEYESMFFFSRKFAQKTVAMQDGMALPIASPNPERALMLLELLRQDREYYNLMTYGVEGVHYNVTAEGFHDPIDPEGFAPEGYCSWGFKDPKFILPQLGMPANIEEVRADLAKIGYISPFAMFNPDWEPIKNERAALTNVEAEYRLPLAFGYIPDVEKGFAELQTQLKNAGLETIKAELQKQLDEYIAAQG